MDNSQESNTETVEDEIIKGPTDESKSFLHKISKGFQRKMHFFFYRLGFFIGGNPLKTILYTFIVTGLCSIGLISYRLETRNSELYTPKGTLAFKHLDFVKKNFPGTSYLRQERIIVTSKEKGGDIATKNGILSLVNVLKVSEATTVMFENQNFTQSDLCFRTPDANGVTHCFVLSVLDLFYDADFAADSQFNFLDTVKAKVDTLTDMQVKEALSLPVFRSWNNGLLYKEKTIGKASGTGETLKVEAFFVEIYLKSESEEQDGNIEDTRTVAWEREWIKNFVGTTIKGAEDKNIYINAVISQQDESQKTDQRDSKYIIMGYTAVLLYVCLMLGHLNRRCLRITLGSFGLGSVGLAYLAAMGIGSALGFPDTPVHNALLLLLFAIGIDDAFVIMTAFDRTDPDLPIPARMAWTLSDAGFAISITSFTNAAAFFIGSLTSLPALKSFCVWAGIGIIFLYFFQSTFFVAIATLDARRRAKDRMDVLFCLPANTDGELNSCGQKHGVMERFFAKKYAACLFNNKIRFPILIATLGMLGTCIYGATQLRLDFDISFLYTDYVRTFENIKNEYSDTVGDIVHIYTGKFDYQTVENQKYMAQLFETSGDLGTSKWVVEESIDSWQINFRTFALLETIESTLEPNEYYIKLKEFLSHPAGSRFVNDIIFDTSTGIPQIAATRSSFLSVFLKNNDIQADFMQSMREILNSSKLPEAFPFTYFFIYYEQYLVLVAEAFQIVFSALLVVFIVTFILISNPLTSIIVLLGVGFSVIDILGLLHFWDINLNSVSVIVLSLAVGLTIDSAAHMGLGFMESVGTRRERIVLSLKHLGPPILHGSTSTLIAISALIPAESYVLKTFFKIFFLIITFGAFHGFVVVPILLDLFGPKSNYNSEEEKNLQITV